MILILTDQKKRRANTEIAEKRSKLSSFINNDADLQFIERGFDDYIKDCSPRQKSLRKKEILNKKCEFIEKMWDIQITQTVLSNAPTDWWTSDSAKEFLKSLMENKK